MNLSIKIIIMIAVVNLLVLPATRNITYAAKEQGQQNQICLECHSSPEEILPENHPPTATIDPGECKKCHLNGKKERSFAWLVHIKHCANDAADCASCHENQEASADRPAVDEDTYNRLEDYYKSWADSSYLDHKHAQAGIGCQECHQTSNPEQAVSEETCFVCHTDYKTLAARTQHVEPNPHQSHLQDLPCALCHKFHQESEYYCNQCHDFESVAP